MNSTLVIQILSLVISSLTLVTLFISVKKLHDWNRRLATVNALTELSQKKFQEWREFLILEFECDVLARTDDCNAFMAQAHRVVKDRTELSAASTGLSPADRRLFCQQLFKMLNALEAVCAALHHRVLDEHIAYDYLAHIVPQVYRFAKPLVEERRREIGYLRMSKNLENFARSWTERAAKAVTVEPRPSL